MPSSRLSDRIAARLLPLRGPLVTLVFFLAGGVCLLRMDPFGFSRLTKIYSQDLLAVAMAGCYPGAKGGPCVRDRRAAVSVVLLRDRDLDRFNEPWPPRYGFHARVLRAIRANKPRAVLIDIVFEDLRDDPSIEALGAELERYREAGIPVYAATFGADHPLRAEVGSRVTPVQVPKKTDPLDRVTRFYDLTTAPPHSQLTAAPTIFRDVCGGCEGNCDAQTARLYWSVMPDDSWNDRWLDCRRRPPFPGWIVQDRSGDFRENCPATPTIPVAVLLEPEEADDAAVERMLQGNIVLYGTYFRGAVDAVNTPLHNDLPAVFLHSTALDNLITLGPKALRHSEPQVPLLGVSLPDFALLILIGAFFTARRRGGRLAAAWERALRCVRFRVGRVLLIALGSQVGMLVVLATVASFVACRFGAAEWLYQVNFLFAFTWTELLDITEKLFDAAEEFERPH